MQFRFIALRSNLSDFGRYGQDFLSISFRIVFILMSLKWTNRCLNRALHGLQARLRSEQYRPAAFPAERRNLNYISAVLRKWKQALSRYAYCLKYINFADRRIVPIALTPPTTPCKIMPLDINDKLLRSPSIIYQLRRSANCSYCTYPAHHPLYNAFWTIGDKWVTLLTSCEVWELSIFFSYAK